MDNTLLFDARARVLADLLACRQTYTGLKTRLIGAAVGYLPATSRTRSPGGP